MKKDKIIGGREIVFILLLIAAVMTLRLAHLYDPLNREEGAFAYAAALTQGGGLPYKDVFDRNPPFIFYLYRAAFDMSGKSADSIRTFTSIYVIFAMLLVYMLARTFGRASTAMLAAFFYMLFLNNSYMQGFASSTAVFTHFTAVFSLYFMLDRDRTYESANFFITGFLLAAAVFTDVVMLPACIVPVIYILRHVREKKRGLAGVLWYLAGFFCLAGLAALWSVKNSVFNAFIDAVVINNFKAFVLLLKTRPPGALFAGAAAFAQANLLLAGAFIYSLAGLFIKKQDHVNFALVSTVLAVMTGVMLFKDPAPHDYAALTPYLSLLAAFMLRDGFDAAVKMKAGGKTAAAAVIILSGLELLYSFFAVSFFGKPADAAGKETVLLEARAIAGEINSAKDAAAGLFVWPNDPEIYFYTGIRAGQKIVNAANFRFKGNEFRQMFGSVYAVQPGYIVMEKGPDEKLFEKLVKTYYSKALEGEKLVLYKKGDPK